MTMLPDTVVPSFNDQELPAAAAACGILHHVFYFKPTRTYLQEVRQQGFLAQWPNGTAVSSDAAVIISLAEHGPGVGLLPRLATRSAPEHLIHETPGTVARSIIAVCLPESLDHPL